MKTLHMNGIKLRVDFVALRNLVSEGRMDNLELFFACLQKAFFVTDVGNDMSNFDIKALDLLLSSAHLEIHIQCKSCSGMCPRTLRDIFTHVSKKVKVREKSILDDLLPLQCWAGGPHGDCRLVIMFECDLDGCRAGLKSFGDMLPHLVALY